MGATVLPTLADIDPATFLPSSRSIAFTRTAWQRAGGYPEWLDYCEDLILDFRLPTPWLALLPGRRRPWRVSTARAPWTAFYKQYYRYARGDGEAYMWRRRHAVGCAAYLSRCQPCSLTPGRRQHTRWAGWAYCLALRPTTAAPGSASHGVGTAHLGATSADPGPGAADSSRGGCRQNDRLPRGRLVALATYAEWSHRYATGRF